jgi:S-DNA-T family DNA segregation ATPase FtsK/SpoIIIE
MKEYQQKLNILFEDFRIKAECLSVKNFENSMIFYIRSYPPTKLSKINSILDEIGLCLKSFSKPELEIVPGTDLFKIKVLSNLPQKELLLENYFFNTHFDSSMNFLLGRKVNGEELITDFAKNPHMIISGTTGSGKSTLVHTIIANAIKNNINLLLIDPKRIEFAPYRIFDNVSVGFTSQDLSRFLDILISDMDYRFNVLEKNGDGTFLFGKTLLIIDEVADIFSNDENNFIKNKLCLLTQKSRAVGIHCLLSTQRPSCDIIDGKIKANFPARLACKTASKVDSRIILDKSGAETLLGNGDALISNYENIYERFQAFYSNAESNVKWLQTFKNFPC